MWSLLLIVNVWFGKGGDQVSDRLRLPLMIINAFLCLFGICFGLSLYRMHFYTLRLNITPIELISASFFWMQAEHLGLDSDQRCKTHPYDFGLLQNLRLNLGNNPLLWFIPVNNRIYGGGGGDGKSTDLSTTNKAITGGYSFKTCKV